MMREVRTVGEFAPCSPSGANELHWREMAAAERCRADGYLAEIHDLRKSLAGALRMVLAKEETKGDTL